MPYLNRDRSDGRYVGSRTDGGASWTDIGVADLASSTSEAIPATSQIVDLFVYNAAETPAYVLLRPHGAQGDEVLTGSLIIPPQSAREFPINFPDNPITVISVLGAVRVEAVLI